MSSTARKITTEESSNNSEDHDYDVHSHDNLVFNKHKKHEDSEGVWLISYSDLMTLLMGFFALLLSMANLDANKLEEVQIEASKVFGGEYKRPFQELVSSLKQVIENSKLKDHIQISSNASGVAVTIKGTLLFDSGSVELRPDTHEIFDQLIPIIKKQASDYFILIEGHTDNVPISHKFIRSNWELSGLRASTIARKFQDYEFKSEMLMIIGWGENKPLLPNKDDQGNSILENQSANRRVIIKILREPISI
jgi:chemotaxis protein MotB